jgi:F-type H+-transporting ATPase subunit gamma
MGGLKEIRRRITSVHNTKQITRAMKLVSAAKLKRAQDAAVAGRGYLDELCRVLAKVSNELPDGFNHVLLEKRTEVKTRQAIVIAGERGLCGGYNTNLLKAVYANENKAGVKTSVVPIGRRAVSAAKKSNWTIAKNYEGLSEDALTWPVSEMVSSAVRDFAEGKCDEVVVYYTKFVTAITQQVTRQVLLPFSADHFPAKPKKGTVGNSVELESKYSPSPEEIFSKMIPLLIQTQIIQCGLESKASEHASRMTAMDSATTNAEDLIGKLRLYYNRARQSAITTELIDIVGGAEAVS